GTLKVVDNYDAIENIPGELIMKILAFDGNLEKIDKASKILAESPNLAISSSSRGNIEITHSDAQKGIALETIAERLGIEMKEVMSIGDNLNDLSMLEKVGYPVAMENGAEEVKKIAKYVTDTNENSGVGKAIMKLLREQQV
ncbi:HAD-IIB family hydrolase, partial [Staphylococcus aureus]